MMELFESAKLARQPVKKVKNTKMPGLLRVFTEHQGDESGTTRGVKLMPGVIEQGLYESEDQFLNRLNRLSSKAQAEANIEQKYDVDFCPKVLSTSDPLPEDGKAKKKKRKEKDIPVDKAREKELARIELKKVKRRARDAKRKGKKKKSNSDDVESTEFEDLLDKVEFGEVAMAPPSLEKFRAKQRKLNK